jgi:cbb3-type cytochrome oxidase maturation protein
VETIFVLLPLALLIAAIALAFFIWAARSGQFDDLETPAVRILFDDEEPRPADPKVLPPKPPETAEEAPTRRVPR